MNIFLFVWRGRMQKAPLMLVRSLVPIFLPIYSHVTIVWLGTMCLWFPGVTNMAHPYWLTLNEKASTPVNSLRAITTRFVKCGIDWAYPGIYIPKLEQKTTIASRKISF